MHRQDRERERCVQSGDLVHGQQVPDDGPDAPRDDHRLAHHVRHRLNVVLRIRKLMSVPAGSNRMHDGWMGGWN